MSETTFELVVTALNLIWTQHQGELTRSNAILQSSRRLYFDPVDTTTMMMRPQSYFRVIRTVRTIPRPTRCLSTTAPRYLGEPDPTAIPAVEAMQSTEDQASMVVAEHQGGSGAVGTFHPEHQPDYRAVVDHGTSLYSPTPRRVQDGSEPGDIVPAAVLSGAPVDLQARTVRHVNSYGKRHD